MCGAGVSAGETGGESGRTRGAGVLREPLTSGPEVSAGGGRGGTRWAASKGLGSGFLSISSSILFLTQLKSNEFK